MSFSAEPFLEQLKPFQRETVEYVFDRYFGADPTDRFLVADEVGLGKTMIARGLIAKLIEHHLKEDGRRIDVIYVCSNQAIAQQNFAKLAIVGRGQRPVTDRITTLPLHVKGLNVEDPELGRGINIIPITPTTSLDLRSSVGTATERALLTVLLRDERLLGYNRMASKGASQMLYPPVQDEKRFAEMVSYIAQQQIDPELTTDFVNTVLAAESDGRLRGGGELRFVSWHSRVACDHSGHCTSDGQGHGLDLAQYCSLWWQPQECVCGRTFSGRASGRYAVSL